MNEQGHSHFLFPVFQPLVNLETGDYIGFEALLRSTSGQSPELIFRSARLAGQLYELDILSIQKAVSSFFSNSDNTSGAPILFINVFPSTLLHSAFLKWINKLLVSYSFVCHRIVLEINETSEEEKMWDIGRLGRIIQNLRQLGFLIALDDVGSGAASIK